MEPDRSTTSLTVRPLDQPEEMHASVDLYRRVLRLDATDPAVSPRLLFALRRNGGSVIGAFAGEQLVGFAYGFLGRDAATGEIYHYSQTAVVADDWQGRGVGRSLKNGQRAYVLDTGITRMRWSFDPVRASNAHFNLDVLGARARWFVRSLYGVDDMGRDLGQPSDRLIVEWDLTGPPHPPAPEQPSTGSATAPSGIPGWGEVRDDGDDLVVGIPRDWPPVGVDQEQAAAVRAAVSAAFERAMNEGYVAVSCRSTPPGGAPASATASPATSAATAARSAWYHLRRRRLP